MSFNSSSGKVHFPFLERKLGPNKPLKLDLAFRNFTVELNQFETDVTLNYIVDVNLSIESSEAILLSDSYELTTSLNLAIKDGKAYFKLIENILNFEGDTKLPIVNYIGLTEADCRELR